PPLRSPLPYTTLFRSGHRVTDVHADLCDQLLAGTVALLGLLHHVVNRGDIAEQLLGAGRDRDLTHVLHQATAIGARAGRSLAIDAHVPDLAGAAVATLDDRPLQHLPEGHPVGQVQVEQIARGPAGAGEMLDQ